MSKKIVLNNNEIAAFCEQMAMITKSGITPRDGLTLMLNDAKDNTTITVLEVLIALANEGNKFSYCIKESGFFPDYVVNMIIVGEETGKSDKVLQSLADYYNHEQLVNDNIRSAISYPLVMLIMMLFIIVILVVKVLPLFEKVYEQLGTHMTGVAATLLHLGDILKRYSILLSLILIAILGLFLFMSYTPIGKKLKAHMRNNFPLTKSFFKNIAYGRFAQGMALTIGSGMGIYQALSLVSELVEHKEVFAQIVDAKDALEKGDSLSDALTGAHMLGTLYSRMVSIGVKTGNVDEIFAKIGNLYEEETDKKLQSFIAIIEPTLVIILSLIVGLIMLSVILPLLATMSNL